LSYENAKKLIKNVDIIAKEIDARREMNANELPTLLYRGKQTVANALKELHILQKDLKIFAILWEEAKSFLNISNGECKIL
jgi:Trk K+ transport system NAD-binding subunit